MKNIDFLGWYLPELIDSNPETGITIKTGGSYDAECSDNTFITQIFRESGTKNERPLPQIIYATGHKAAVAVHYWCIQAFINKDDKAESFLKGADYLSDDKTAVNLVEITPPDYFEKIFGKSN